MAFTTVPRAVQIGRVGEFLAQAIFEDNSYKTARVNHEGFDLLVFDDAGDAIRVEVKASSRSHGKSYKFATATGSKSKRLLSADDTDIVVMVAIDLRRIVVRHVSEIVHKRTTVSESSFLDDESEGTQIRKAIAKVRELRK